jgi:ABC-2 type transport system ATP-binding protein
MTGIHVVDDVAVSTTRLGKSYRSVAALRECTISVPTGRVCALVGPNGAGKTTLLKLLAGLGTPTTGEAIVLGRQPGQDPAFLADIGFLAQEIPLWRRFSAREHIAIGARLNPSWDGDAALQRVADVGVDLDRRVATLSGGERAQVALSLALAKRPRLLLLDEPVAALDPLARRHFMAALVEAVADSDLTVVISSHLIGDLERICDHLVLLAVGRPQLCGDISELLAEHRLITGPRRDPETVAGVSSVVEVTNTARQTTALVRLDGDIIDPSWEIHDVSLEEIVLAYMGQNSPAARALHPVGGDL